MVSMRWLLVKVALAFAGVGAIGLSATAAVMSNFNTNAEGWENVGAPVDYFATGGNPGGHIAVTDFTGEWAYLSEMQSVLDNLTRLVVATDYSNGITDRTFLDNVRLNASEVPSPAAVPLFDTVLAGGGMVAWRRMRGRKLPPAIDEITTPATAI